MPKKIDYYQDFLKTIEFKDREARNKRQKNLAVSLTILVVYFSFLSIFLLQNKEFALFPFFKKENPNILTDINSRIASIETRINSITSTSTQNLSYTYLDSKIADIQLKNSYLYDTILTSPDSAITPKILREEQNNLKEKFQDLKNQVEKTNNLLSGIFITSLLAIGGYIIKQIWSGFISRKNSIKE